MHIKLTAEIINAAVRESDRLYAVKERWEADDRTESETPSH